MEGRKLSQPRHIEEGKSGYLEKFSLGRGPMSFVCRNWQRRWVRVDSTGLKYFKSPRHEKDGKEPLGEVPFRRQTLRGFSLDHVLLYSVVTTEIHPAASDPFYSYFGIQFVLEAQRHFLLLRTPSAADRDAWRSYLCFVLQEGGLSEAPQSPVGDKASSIAPMLFQLKGSTLSRLSSDDIKRIDAVMSWDDGMELGDGGRRMEKEDTGCRVEFQSDDEDGGEGSNLMSASCLDLSAALAGGLSPEDQRIPITTIVKSITET